MLIARLWAIRDDEGFRDKVVEMATEFCVEASVLICVLGILEAAIAVRGIPPYRVFLYSGILGVSFFAMGCIIQAWRAIHREEPDALEEDAP